ncbi:MAG: sugar phosphate isomerase/epimerase [Planctomycetes bacterium]|nr:sugar phosphate isomerase/epimerase [Planctomycetota bacterium]
MKIGMNLLLWTGSVSDRDLPTIRRLKEIGYDGVELPIFAPDESLFSKLGKRLDELAISRTAVTIRGPEDNPISPERSIREKGIAATKAAIDSCAAVGAETLVGPFHSAIGVFSGAPPTRDEWQWGVESMQRVAEHAAKCGVDLGVEPLNRFECYLLNSHADAARFVREVAHPNCRVLYDTFHANIEEKHVGEAVRACADVLGHVHISENDRSTPGRGAVRWNETFDALAGVGYDGWLVVEAFGMALPEIAAATKIWRRMFDSEDQLAKEALQFVRGELARRN